MKLREWFETQPMRTRLRVAQRLGVHATTLSQIAGGKKPSFDLAARISDATDGAVSIEELGYYIPARARLRADEPQHPDGGRMAPDLPDEHTSDPHDLKHAS